MVKNKQRLRIYSALEVANICGVVNQTAINWIRNGHLKAFITPGGQYRVYEEDLSGFLTSRGMGNSVDALHLTKGRDKGGARNGQWTALIIDHDHNASGQLKNRLKSEFPEFKILQAYDAFDAGWRLYQQKPNMVFLNVEIPGISIPKLVKRLKTDPALGFPAVIALANNGFRTPRHAAWAEALISQPAETGEIVRNLGYRLKVTA
jgi:excisionase family DNA binding protein